MPGLQEHDELVRAHGQLHQQVISSEPLERRLIEEYQRLLAEVAAVAQRFHESATAAHSAHSAHLEKAKEHVEKHASHAEQAGQHAATQAAAAAQAQGEVSAHEEGSESHAAAQAAHEAAQAGHAEAQAQHEEAVSRHARARDAHERATHHAERAAHNREQADAVKQILEELNAVMAILMEGIVALEMAESEEARAEIRARHQPHLEQVRSHSERLHHHVHSVHRESLEDPDQAELVDA